ncbi:hypothetical protein LJR219_004031 [Phenylobacterium sp. LjRoot219]|uniref:hypothetical protein n=1 Tax=Phenylobacterium sp. LjRoot219 TaxID=3342283 RepID=UPI003ECD0E25
MRLIHALTAAALLAIPTTALAQAMERDQPSTSSSAPSPSAGAGASSSTGAAATVTAGLPVKDKTGTTIGSVTEVKTDAGGNKVATIKMGADSFAVDTSALAVDNGSAVINSTQAEIKAMLPKK